MITLIYPDRTKIMETPGREKSAGGGQVGAGEAVYSPPNYNFLLFFIIISSIQSLQISL
jgi:hypothetical protein